MRRKRHIATAEQNSAKSTFGSDCSGGSGQGEGLQRAGNVASIRGKFERQRALANGRKADLWRKRCADALRQPEAF